MNAIEVLSHGLCPWLRGHYDALEHARTRQRLGHAWLLSGPWGLGKINLALVMAERLLGSSGAAPGELSAESAGMARRDLYEAADHRPDLHFVFPGGLKESIGVEQIRDACRELSLSSLQGVAKVLVIEPAEAMTVAAANALLKTLEEPTPHTYLWLVSHQPGRLLPTIRSRCQKLTLCNPPTKDIARWLSASKSGLEPRIGETPFKCLERIESINLNELEEQISDLSKNRADPQTMADQWLRDGLEPRLEGLSVLLWGLVRATLAPGQSNGITESSTHKLHTTAAALGPRGLLCLLERTEQLLAQRGSGLNEDLAVRVLLLEIQNPSLLLSRRS